MNMPLIAQYQQCYQLLTELESYVDRCAAAMAKIPATGEGILAAITTSKKGASLTNLLNDMNHLGNAVEATFDHVRTDPVDYHRLQRDITDYLAKADEHAQAAVSTFVPSGIGPERERFSGAERQQAAEATGTEVQETRQKLYETVEILYHRLRVEIKHDQIRTKVVASVKRLTII